MTKFIKKHPWLLFKCIALTSWFCGFLAKSFLPMASKPAPEAPLAPTVALETTLEVGRAAIDNLRQAVSNIEKAVELPPTRKLKKSSKKG